MVVVKINSYFHPSSYVDLIYLYLGHGNLRFLTYATHSMEGRERNRNKSERALGDPALARLHLQFGSPASKPGQALPASLPAEHYSNAA